MIKEERTVFLSILTLLLYVIVNLVEKGIFAFPYPLNEPIVLIVSFTFFYWHYKKHYRLILLFGLSILFRLFSQNFIWNLCLSDQNYLKLTETLFPDILYCLYLIHFFLFAFFYLKENGKNPIYIGLALFGLLISCLFFPEIEFLFLLVLSLFAFLYKRNTQIYLLLLLFVALEGFKVLTYVVNYI